MPADQPTPGQVASFDQTLAALGTNLDALITVYGGELADGQHPGISTAGLAEWLLTQSDAVGLAEHLAAAVRRLHEAGAAYERGLAEGRRQATEGWEREWGTRVGDGPVESHASEHSARRWASGDRGVLVEVVSRLDGPWEPAPQGDVPTAPERPAASILAAVGGVADDDAPWPICWAGHLGMLCDRKRDHLGDHVDVYGPLPDHTWTDPLLHTHESGGPYRDCPECIAKAGRIREADRG